MGITSRLPRSTREPCWFHSVSWAEIVGSWSIRASIWAGP